MPLVCEERHIDTQLITRAKKEESYSLFHHEFPTLKDCSESLKNATPQKLSSNVLYVSQREYSVIDPSCRGTIKYIACDEATTCHIVALIHPASHVIGISHFDSCNTAQGVGDLLDLMGQRVDFITGSQNAAPDTSYDLYIAGGFKDDRKSSIELSNELTDALHSRPERLNLKVMCMTDTNDVIKHGYHYPAVYGLGVDISSLDVCSVVCTDKGPEKLAKTCRIFTGSQKMINFFNCDTGSIEITPFAFRQIAYLDDYLRLPLEDIVEYLSTSPRQEPEGFAEHTLQTLYMMKKHPKPLETYFDRQARVYRLNGDGEWILMS